MELIRSFLERYSNLTPPDAIVRKVVSEKINEIISINVDIKKIKISRGIAFIQTSPGAKNKLFLKKQKVLSHVWETLGKKIPTDIR